MPPAAAQVLADLLALPREQRQDVLEEALRSLDDGPAEDPAAVNAAWGEEIHRRIALRKAGLSMSTPAAEAIAEIRAHLQAQRESRSR